MWVAIVFIIVGGSLYVFKSCRDVPLDLIRQSGKALADVASVFKRGSATTSFVSYATTISNHHFLQFSTLRQTEIFKREEPGTVLGYPLLPDVIVEARAPVEYTYYLDLNDRWRFDLRDNVVYVFAPSIKFNKPAVDVSAISYEVKKGVASAGVQENLKKSLSGLVAMRARENIPLIRENGRKQTAEFVEKWLMNSFTDGKRYPVKVFFPGEFSSNAIVVPNPRLN
jgi:hypothetical protein